MNDNLSIDDHVISPSYDDLHAQHLEVGEAKKKKQSAMGNHVARMLMAFPMPCGAKSLHEVPRLIFDDVEATFIGKFSTYIGSMKTINTWNAHKKNVSALHVFIVESYPELETVMAFSYSGILSELEKSYLKKAESSGEDMVKNAVLIYRVGNHNLQCSRENNDIAFKSST